MCVCVLRLAVVIIVGAEAEEVTQSFDTASSELSQGAEVKLAGTVSSECSSEYNSAILLPCSDTS